MNWRLQKSPRAGVLNAFGITEVGQPAIRTTTRSQEWVANAFGTSQRWAHRVGSGLSRPIRYQ